MRKKILYVILILWLAILGGIVHVSQKIDTKMYRAIKTNYLSETVEKTEDDIIKFTLIGTDSNKVTCSLKLSDITIIIGTTEVPQSELGDIKLGTINYPQTNKATCVLTLKGVPGEGQLKIKIAANTLTDIAGNRNSEKTLATEVTMVAAGITASKIVANPTSYYGKTISNYECSAVSSMLWRVFYSDQSNIYIISDKMIPYNNLPTKGGYSFNQGYATEESVAVAARFNDNMLSLYNGNYTNDKAVALMLDQTLWSGFKDSTYADFAVGGPTLEQYISSYNATHSETLLEINKTYNEYGYGIKWSKSQEYGTAVTDVSNGPNEYNGMYSFSGTRENGMQRLFVGC